MSRVHRGVGGFIWKFSGFHSTQQAPSRHILIVSRGIMNVKWDLDGMLKKLAEEIEAREHAVAAHACTQPRSYCIIKGIPVSSCTNFTEIEVISF